MIKYINSTAYFMIIFLILFLSGIGVNMLFAVPAIGFYRLIAFTPVAVLWAIKFWIGRKS